MTDVHQCVDRWQDGCLDVGMTTHTHPQPDPSDRPDPALESGNAGESTANADPGASEGIREDRPGCPFCGEDAEYHYTVAAGLTHNPVTGTRYAICRACLDMPGPEWRHRVARLTLTPIGA